ncbi:MAG: SDR family oxidoreductase [Nitrospinota bacterium]|nr:SDR family oxidoreductase [Nitrospinota bacterium]
MALIGIFKKNGPTGFGYNSTAEEVTAGLDLSGKTYLLTGSGSGLGLETLRVLSMRGGHVIAAARSLEAARFALRSVRAEGAPVACDLSEPSSARELVHMVKSLNRPLDAIICNAGVMALPKATVKHGLELQFLTNHIGHFILVTGLLGALAPQGRVVMVSSGAHNMAPAGGIEFDNLDGQRGYGPWRNYGQSKLANLLFARQLARKLEGSGQKANALHPGVINTNLGRHMNPLAVGFMKLVRPIFLKTIPQGAATQCYLAAHPDADKYNGEYFADCNPAASSALGQDMDLAARLWEATEKLIEGGL